MSEKWWDMSDDELDELFREASDRVNIPFDQSALDKLRQKIDLKPIPPAAPQWGFTKRWLALLALLIFLGGALLYTFSVKKDDLVLGSNPISENQLSSSTHSSNEKLNESIEKQSFENQKSTPTTISKDSKIIEGEIPTTATLNEKSNLPNASKSESITNNSVSSKNDMAEKNARNVKEKDSAGNEIIEKKITSTSQKSILRKNTDFRLPPNRTPLTKSESNNTSKNNYQENKYLDNSSLGNIDKKVSTTTEQNNSINIEKKSSTKNIAKLYTEKNPQNKYSNTTTLSGVYQEVNTPNIISENNTAETEKTVPKMNFYDANFLNNKSTLPLLVNITAESPSYVDAPPVPIKQPKPSRFGIRLVLAPDINSLDRIGTSALGSSLGLLFEYRLGKKLVAQTGIAYSTKQYVSSFDSYNNWATNWKPYHPSKPVEVDGGCKVFDLPINLRLNVFQKPKSTFFISSGISSYFMMNETYTYQYVGAPDRSVAWNDKSSFYWSTLNLSAGIERKLNKHFTFQVEPYLKTPLTNIGRGGVSLYSSGLLFSTKYEF